jgi:hypothetical protein
MAEWSSHQFPQSLYCPFVLAKYIDGKKYLWLVSVRHGHSAQFLMSRFIFENIGQLRVCIFFYVGFFAPIMFISSELNTLVSWMTTVKIILNLLYSELYSMFSLCLIDCWPLQMKRHVFSYEVIIECTSCSTSMSVIRYCPLDFSTTKHTTNRRQKLPWMFWSACGHPNLWCQWCWPWRYLGLVQLITCLCENFREGCFKEPNYGILLCNKLFLYFLCKNCEIFTRPYTCFFALHDFIITAGNRYSYEPWFYGNVIVLISRESALIHPQ